MPPGGAAPINALLEDGSISDTVCPKAPVWHLPMPRHVPLVPVIEKVLLRGFGQNVIGQATGLITLMDLHWFGIIRRLFRNGDVGGYCG